MQAKLNIKRPAITHRQKSLAKQKGFTLIELLVALSISAVIAVMAYQAIDSVVKAKTQVQSHSQRMESVQRTVWWLEQDLIQAAPRAINGGYGTLLPAFQYRADLGLELTRIADFPTPISSGGLLRVAYQLEDGILYRLVWPVIDRAPDSQPTKLAILTDVKGFEIRLLQQDNQWTNNWPVVSVQNQAGQASQTALPKVTEVTLELEDLGKVTRLFMGLN